MPPEIALLESRALRDSVAHRTRALDKVKALVLLPDDVHVTTRMVAAYFEVRTETVQCQRGRLRTPPGHGPTHPRLRPRSDPSQAASPAAVSPSLPVDNFSQ